MIKALRKRIFKRISAKLHNREGVTILLSLVLFLAAAMVSAVIIGSAVSGINRVNDDRDNQQSMETLISAAQMISTEMNGSCIVRSELQDADTGADTVTYRVEEDGETPHVFAPLLRNCVERLESQPGGTCTADFTVKTSQEAMKPVDVSLVMTREEDDVAASDARSYKVTMTLTLQEQEEYYTFIDMTANQSVTSASEGRRVKTETTIRWNEPVIHGAVRSVQ